MRVRVLAVHVHDVVEDAAGVPPHEWIYRRWGGCGVGGVGAGWGGWWCVKGAGYGDGDMSCTFARIAPAAGLRIPLHVLPVFGGHLA